MKLQGFNQNLG